MGQVGCIHCMIEEAIVNFFFGAQKGICEGFSPRAKMVRCVLQAINTVPGYSLCHPQTFAK